MNAQGIVVRGSFGVEGAEVDFLFAVEVEDPGFVRVSQEAEVENAMTSGREIVGGEFGAHAGAAMELGGDE